MRPRARRHPARRPGGGARLQLPGRDRSARLAPRREREHEAGAGGGAGDRGRATARALRGRRDAQRRGLCRASRARGVVAATGRDDADGEERVPGDTRTPLRLAGHARRKVVELGDEQVRRARGGRRALRRPGHRQALGVRPRGDGRPPRRRRRRDREAAARRHPGRRAPEADPGRARDRVRSAEEPGRRLADRALARATRRLARGVPASLRGGRRPAQAATGARVAAGSDRRPRRRDLDDRRRPAPDVGDAVPPLRPAAQLHHLGRPRHDGLRRSGRRRRQGRAPGRDRRLRRRGRVLPDDLAGARDLGDRGPADRRRDREQRLPRHGPAVAGHVLRGAVLAGPPGRGLARLRQARGGVRRSRPPRRHPGRARPRALGGAGLRPHGGRRLPRRSSRALLPDDPGRSGRARSTSSSTASTESGAGSG